MANYKRKKPRTNVRCRLCTDGRDGNKNKDDRSTGAERRVKQKRGWREEQTRDLEIRILLD